MPWNVTAVFEKLWVLFRVFVPISTTINGLVKTQLCDSFSATLVKTFTSTVFNSKKKKKKYFSSIPVWKKGGKVLRLLSLPRPCFWVLAELWTWFYFSSSPNAHTYTISVKACTSVGDQEHLTKNCTFLSMEANGSNTIATKSAVPGCTSANTSVLNIDLY